jgi:hypothetical protein
MQSAKFKMQSAKLKGERPNNEPRFGSFNADGKLGNSRAASNWYIVLPFCILHFAFWTLP